MNHDWANNDWELEMAKREIVILKEQCVINEKIIEDYAKIIDSLRPTPPSDDIDYSSIRNIKF